MVNSGKEALFANELCHSPFSAVFKHHIEVDHVFRSHE